MIVHNFSNKNTLKSAPFILENIDTANNLKIGISSCGYRHSKNLIYDLIGKLSYNNIKFNTNVETDYIDLHVGSHFIKCFPIEDVNINEDCDLLILINSDTIPLETLNNIKENNE
jgi:hypothetical protein